MADADQTAVFLDRDGTINREMHYLRDPEDLELLPGAAEGMLKLQRSGCRLVVVTNQSAIGRGLLDEDRLEEIHGVLEQMLAEHGVLIAGWYWCPHLPEDNCACRKPRPGMLRRAAEELEIELNRSWMIGDKIIDAEAGRRAGAKSVLVATGYGKEQYELPERERVVDHYAGSLLEAADFICNDVGAELDSFHSARGCNK